MRTSRRKFIQGCCGTVAAYTGSKIGLTAFASTDAGGFNNDVVVVVFLRGGIDGLNFLPPIAGAQRGVYETYRPTLQIPLTGTAAALALAGTEFGLHPGADSLHQIYQGGKVALIQGAGMPDSSRSHFDAMLYMEFGTPGQKSAASGWLTRHLQSAENLPESIIMPSISIGDLPAASLSGSYDVLTLNGPNSFNLNEGYWQYRNSLRVSMRQLYELSDSPFHAAGKQALRAMDIIEGFVTSSYAPANGAVYPNGGFGSQLATIAQMIKIQEVGLRAATIDLGGWDTHENQGEAGGGYFNTHVSQLSDAISAFFTDLNGSDATAPINRTTLVVMSEFGRRVRQNGDAGTDHGTGNVMVVMGGGVNGGVYGAFPGLSEGELYDGADLRVTTDYRQVLSEILIRRHGNPYLGKVFPKYEGYAPLNVVQGSDLTPIYSTK